MSERLARLQKLQRKKRGPTTTTTTTAKQKAGPSVLELLRLIHGEVIALRRDIDELRTQLRQTPPPTYGYDPNDEIPF